MYAHIYLVKYVCMYVCMYLFILSFFLYVHFYVRNQSLCYCNGLFVLFCAYVRACVR